MSEALTNDFFLSQLKQHATIQMKKFTWDKSGLTALSCIEQLVASQTGTSTNEVELSHLISAISSIQCQENPSDNDLRSTAEAIDRNIKLLELQSLNLEKLSWQIEGPYDSSYSLALVNREFARALDKSGVKVLLNSTEGPGDFKPSESFLNDSCNSDIKRYHQRFKKIKGQTVNILSRNVYPPRVSHMNAQVKLLHCYAWEESKFPQEWINNFNCELDAILCTSEHVRKVLIDNGTKVPVFTVGNGGEHWERIKSGNKPVLNAKKFKFLHVSSCFPRKGVEVMLAAFGLAFTGNDEVTLIIKTFSNPHNEVYDWLKKVQAQHANYPDVIIIEEDMPEQDLKALYEYCDVLLAPSCAEGFGLPIVEAILSGLPAITTNWSGQVDFCTEENAWLIDYQFAHAKTHFNLYASSWANTDLNKLAETMKQAVATDKTQLRKMASKGKEIILNRFTWSHVAESSIAAISALQERFEEANKVACIGWLSPWNIKCGIATYSQHLVANTPSDKIIIFASKASNRIKTDEKNVIRNWVSGKESNSLCTLDKSIEAFKLNTLVIQFNYGFFNHRELSAFIEKHHYAGRVLIMVMHSTIDPLEKEPSWNFRLSEMSDALKKCDRLLVHSIADINRLKKLGITNNVTLFPHGIITWHSQISHSAKHNSPPLVASYGFCLPHKGLKELIQAAAHLKAVGNPIRLRLVNAEYPVHESAKLVHELKSMISKLNLENLIEMHHHFLDDKESLDLLSEADLLVFTYQNTEESASGAVRYGMTTQKPVAVTPLPIFDDLEDAVFKFKGTTITDIAEGIAEIIDGINKKSTTVLETQKRAESWRKQHCYSVVAKRLKNMCTGLLRAKQFK